MGSFSFACIILFVFHVVAGFFLLTHVRDMEGESGFEKMYLSYSISCLICQMRHYAAEEDML